MDEEMVCSDTENCSDLANAKVRIAALQLRMQQIERMLENNTKITLEIKQNTSDIIDAFHTLRGGVKTLKIIGEIIKWATGIIIGIVSTYYLFRDGKLHLPW